MQCCNKHVIIYSGARVSEFIRAIRSFISIDIKQKHGIFYIQFSNTYNDKIEKAKNHTLHN